MKKGQLHCNPAKAETIAWLIPPETRNQLRAFLGLAGYYKHLISGFVAKARPLYVLLWEDSVWQWEEAENEAFETLKACLCADPGLRLSQPDKPYTLSMDCFAYAISAVLE